MNSPSTSRDGPFNRGSSESGSVNLSRAKRYTSLRCEMADLERRRSASADVMISPRYLSTNWPFLIDTGDRTPVKN